MPIGNVGLHPIFHLRLLLFRRQVAAFAGTLPKVADDFFIGLPDLLRGPAENFHFHIMIEGVGIAAIAV